LDGGGSTFVRNEQRWHKCVPPLSILTPVFVFRAGGQTAFEHTSTTSHDYRTIQAVGQRIEETWISRAFLMGC
jgi:hypothetical protein